MTNIYRIFALLLACATCLSAPAAVTASLDQARIALGETVQLLVQSDASTDSMPDIGPLKRDFDVLGSSRGSSMQIINGQKSAQTQLTVVLAPKHEGALQIPPLQWGTQQSPALELTVSGSANAGRQNGNPADGSAPIFLTAAPDQKQPYVQGAVVLTVRLYAGLQIHQASLDLPGSSDVLVKQFGKDIQSSESRNGRHYQVVERKYILLPQRSGRISLKGPVLDAQVQNTNSDAAELDSFFGNAFGHSPLGGLMNTTRSLHLLAKPIELNVLPRPSRAGANWLPAQTVTLEESWRPDNAVLRVGEPFTRHLHLTALGLTGVQLPDIGALMSVPDGIKPYPDQSQTDDNARGATVLGSRDQDIALVANSPGHYTLPAVRVVWWDTTRNVQREAVLAPRTLDIRPSPTDHVTAPPPPENLPPSRVGHSDAEKRAALETRHALPWQKISIALGLLWFGTALAWWHSRRRGMPAMPTPAAVVNPMPAMLHGKNALSALQRACRDNDPHAARRHLLEWAAGFWPECAPHGLNALALLLAETKSAEPIRQLDRACYTDGIWQGDSFARAFATLPRRAPSAKAKPALPELYP